MIIQLVNQRPLFDDNGKELNFAISANSAPQNLQSNPVVNFSGVQYNTSYPFSVFSGSSNITISMDFIDSGRIYFGYDTLPTNNIGVIAPLPDGNQYYGWIELSRKAADKCVWINLSNVDIVGLPMTLSGSSGWSLGYKNSIDYLIGEISSAFPGAVVSGETKNRVVGPDIKPSAYPSFNSYFSKLSRSKTRLCINSDTLAAGEQEIFLGGFNPNKKAISLKSLSGNEIVIFYSALTSHIIYKGDGATLYLNGVEYPENRSGSTDSVIKTNSVFRNIIIGLNEGYFETNPKYSSGVNYSINYSYLVPFGKNGHTGNMYAKMIHNSSNSYGFPYADSNLKTLIQAPLTDLIKLTIINDDVAGYCYDNNAESTQNSPGAGFNQLGFGTNCNALRNISIGNCNYPATTNISGTGGFLPYVTEFVPMVFHGANNKYIWVNPVSLKWSVYDSSGNACLLYNGNVNAPAIPSVINLSGSTGQLIGRSLVWGAGITWNPKASSAVKP